MAKNTCEVTPRKVFALHPRGPRGLYVSPRSLAKLWNVPFEWCVVWDDTRYETYIGRRIEDYVHLSPMLDGKYERYTEETLQQVIKNSSKTSV